LQTYEKNRIIIKKFQASIIYSFFLFSTKCGWWSHFRTDNWIYRCLPP